MAFFLESAESLGDEAISNQGKERDRLMLTLFLLTISKKRWSRDLH